VVSPMSPIVRPIMVVRACPLAVLASWPLLAAKPDGDR
jgi:hypothetical protein